MENRILLGQLSSNGDCLYTTAIARQIKHDFPGCHLTWAISSLCRKVIENNPFVDEIWEIPVENWQAATGASAWDAFEREALKLYESGFYDFVFFTQICPGNFHHFEGAVRRGIFLGYPGKITVPIKPTLVLTKDEVQEVYEFADRHGLGLYDRVILFECSSKSGQSKITPEIAYKISQGIVSSRLENCAVILCSQYEIPDAAHGIIDGSKLSLRAMAELTKYCDLLIGCSSGISCIASSNWAKSIPMIQLLNKYNGMFASLAHDYSYFGLPDDHVIEMFDFSLDSIWACYRALVNEGWQKTQTLFHQRVDIGFTYYLELVRYGLVKEGDFYGVCVSLGHTIERYGYPQEIRDFLEEFAKKHLKSRMRTGKPGDILDQLKAHFRKAWNLGPDGHTWNLCEYEKMHRYSVRPETCEIKLRHKKQDYLSILNTQHPAGSISPYTNETIAEMILQRDSVELFQKIKESEPDNPMAITALALSLLENASFKEAYDLLHLLRKNTQGEWSVEFDRLFGDLAWMNGSHAEALESYKKCLHQDAGDKRLPRLIARLNERQHSGAIRLTENL